MAKYQVRQQNFKATFNGRHNYTKAKVLLFLYERYLTKQPDISLKDLSTHTRTGYKNLSSLITRWLQWQYIGYRSTPHGRVYRINLKGRQWCDRWYFSIPITAIERDLGWVE